MTRTSDPRGASRSLRAVVLEALLPQRCLVCGRFGASLHVECLARLPVAGGERCIRCWRPGAGTWCERCASGGPQVPAFDGLRAPFRFEGDARRAILEAKFRGVTAHLPVLARVAASVVPAEWGLIAVTGVPLTGARQRRRGYNQSAIAARAVAEALGVPYRPRLLERVRETPPQASLSAERRATNVDGVFRARGVPPERVLVVDDVTTTGATLASAAATLKAAGAARVYGLALARED